MYSIIPIVVKFGNSSRHFHVNNFVLHYSITLALHICSLRLLCIPVTSYASTLWKFTLCNTWRRTRPTTFHSNPLFIAPPDMIWLDAHSIQFGLSCLQCGRNQCELNADLMSIQYPVRTGLKFDEPTVNTNVCGTCKVSLLVMCEATSLVKLDDISSCATLHQIIFLKNILKASHFW